MPLDDVLCANSWKGRTILSTGRPSTTLMQIILPAEAPQRRSGSDAVHDVRAARVFRYAERPHSRDGCASSCMTSCCLPYRYVLLRVLVARRPLARGHGDYERYRAHRSEE